MVPDRGFCVLSEEKQTQQKINKKSSGVDIFSLFWLCFHKNASAPGEYGTNVGLINLLFWAYWRKKTLKCHFFIETNDGYSEDLSTIEYNVNALN